MKKFIANASNNVGQGEVTKKVLEFLEYKGDARLETNEITIDHVRKIAAEKSIDLLKQPYKKIITCL